MAGLTGARWREAAPVAGIAICLLLAVVLVDPFGEVLLDDDGFAYARSVRHLVQTGEYQLDPWSAANMPVQIYLAAGLSTIFGYSLDLLKLTTVGVLGVGLACFYGLARELRAARWSSFAATLALLASPLCLLLAFTFQSDIQFTGWLIAALFLYVRGLRRDSGASVFMGSIAAAAAIGTRQFGVAIIGGLLIALALCRREDRPRMRTMLLALALPMVAAGWQIRSGLQDPTFTQVVRLYEQKLYLGQSPMFLAQELLWRPAVLLQYVGISLLPALPLVVAAVLTHARRSRRNGWQFVALTALIGFALCALLLIGSPLAAPRVGLGDWPWPPLGLEWLLPFWLPAELVRPIDLAGLTLAAGVGAAAACGMKALWPIRRNCPETILLVAVPGCMLCLHLAYMQFNDTYLVPFVPFALLMLAVLAPDHGTPRRALPALGVSLIGIVVLSLMLRQDYAEERTRWAAADRLTLAGHPSSEIYASSAWMRYHGAFDRWLAAGHPGFEVRALTRPVLYWLYDPYFRWETMLGQHATYCIVDDRISGPGRRLIGRESYRDRAFKQRDVFTYEAVDTTKESSRAVCWHR